jgi:plasmid stabilization system protein ParE
MTSLERLPDFARDYEAQFDWYVCKAGRPVALRFEQAVEMTFIRLSRQPTLGRVRRFSHPKLAGLRSLAVVSPFDRILIFYRIHQNTIIVWRLMHGARNLSRRLLEPND